MKINKITIFEHNKLIVDKEYNGVIFKESYYNQLIKFYNAQKEKDSLYTLIANGIKFKEYVGVIQIGNLQIEVLPKADKDSTDENKWRKLLINMLREIELQLIKAPSSSWLKLIPNSILELYIEIFISELEYLIRTGLIKQYHPVTSNQAVLKGSLYFPKHITHNLVHKELFYTRNITYNYDHIWHSIFRETIQLIKTLTDNAHLHNRIKALELYFPEVQKRTITAQTFANLKYNRKTEGYRAATEIAKLLLLNFHPDLSSGTNHILALMFDMNKLWEKFIYITLRKQFIRNQSKYNVYAQRKKLFWSSEYNKREIKPDIIIQEQTNEANKQTDCYILDTKWKVPENINAIPSDSDLMQIFAYANIFNTHKNALVYPGNPKNSKKGHYESPEDTQKETIGCDTILLECKENIKEFQESIYNSISEWLSQKME